MNKLLRVYFSLLLVSVWLVGCGPFWSKNGSSSPVSIDNDQEKAQHAIVKIISKGRTGTGFIVAVTKEENKVYIVTQNHTIENDAHPKVQFFGSTDETPSVVLQSVGNNIGTGDNAVAILLVKKIPTNITLSKLFLSKESCKKASEVFTYRGDWSKATTNFSELQGAEICIFEGGKGAIIKGNSGGPLIDKIRKSEQGLLLVWAVIAAIDEKVWAVSANHVRGVIEGLEGGVGDNVIKLMEEPGDDFTLKATLPEPEIPTGPVKPVATPVKPTPPPPTIKSENPFKSENPSNHSYDCKSILSRWVRGGEKMGFKSLNDGERAFYDNNCKHKH